MDKSKKRTDLIEFPDKDLTTAGKVVSWFNIFVFFMLLFCGGALFFVLPEKKISISEKRKLAPMPHFSEKNYFAGMLTDSLDLFYADNFPFRDEFVDFAAMLDENYGFRANDVKIYNLAIAKKPAARIISSIDSAKLLPDSLTIDTLDNDGEHVKSLVIYHGKAYQIFGGSKHSARAYAGMINKFKEDLGDSVHVFCLIMPTSTDFYLPSKYKGRGNPEKQNMEVVYADLNANVSSVDAWSEIDKHLDDYLYFYTDHHWTARGAYYAYRAFCGTAGFTPFDLSKFTRRIRKSFLGSLYDMTKDERLRENRDSVEYFLLPYQTKTYRYTEDLSKPIRSSLFAESSYTYSLFLGGDNPLVRIDSDNHTGRKIMIIKDSYGNAISPYFALHYDQVYIADYRYFNHNIVKFIRSNKITDLIFLHNSFAANSRYTVRRETYLMNMKPKPAIETIKKDTIKGTALLGR